MNIVGPLWYHMSRVGFKLPMIDDTSYEADALPTKPPRPDYILPFGISSAKLESNCRRCKWYGFSSTIVQNRATQFNNGPLTNPNQILCLRYSFLAPPVSEDQLAKWDPEQQAELEREALPETNCVWYMSRSPGHRHLVKKFS